jgi:hypothetical protein
MSHPWLAFPQLGGLSRLSHTRGINYMWPTFNLVMRVVSSLIGVAMILMGSVWMLQGLNLAFRVGFMVGNYHWTIYGALLALVGVAEVVWSNTRQVRV